jgi:hypothetical protein
METAVPSPPRSRACSLGNCATTTPDGPPPAQPEKGSAFIHHLCIDEEINVQTPALSTGYRAIESPTRDDIDAGMRRDRNGSEERLPPALRLSKVALEAGGHQPCSWARFIPT